MTEIKTPSTPVAPLNIETWAKWFEFETCGDPQLIRMIEQSARFVMDVDARKPTPWLVLTGTSGAGKTHVARKIFRWWQSAGRFYESRTGASCVMQGQFCLWADFIQSCYQKDSSRMDDMITEQLIVLDDIGAGTAESKAWMIDKLYYVIEKRMKPAKFPASYEAPRMSATIITANLSLEQLAVAYDQRIASRLIRNGREKVVQVNVKDFALR